MTESAFRFANCYSELWHGDMLVAYKQDGVWRIQKNIPLFVFEQTISFLRKTGELK